MDNTQKQPATTLSLVVITGLLVWGSVAMGPLYQNGILQWLPAGLGALALAAGWKLSIAALEHAATLMDWLASRTPTGKAGTARWAGALDLWGEIAAIGRAPFWGLRSGGWVFARRLFIDFAAVAWTLAPTGAGKTAAVVVPMILAIRTSKLVSDFKAELVVMCAGVLRARGECVRILNPANLFQERIGETDCYNPQDMIADNFERPGGLRDVPDDVREMAKQIIPEPGGKSSDDTYWREWSRRLIAFVMVLEVIIDGRQSTFANVALLLQDRTRLADLFRWVAGLDLEGKPLPGGPMPIEQAPWAALHDVKDVHDFAEYVRSTAKGMLGQMEAGDGRSFDSALAGAQQAVAPYAFGRLSAAMGRSTFSMADLKDPKKPTTLFLVPDASRMEAYQSYMGLMQWCCLTALKRHENKESRVYAFIEEATNAKIEGLESLMTWGRSYGIRLHIIFQSLDAFEQVYGKSALATLISESDVKQFLPGQRAERALDLIVKLLGEQSVMTSSLSPGRVRKSGGETASESQRPLMTADEVRRSRHGILFVRQRPPVRFTPIPYASIHPWRSQVGVNPFHGKPWKKRIRMWLWRG